MIKELLSRQASLMFLYWLLEGQQVEMAHSMSAYRYFERLKQGIDVACDDLRLYVALAMGLG